ncbi:pentatricopeptide repeat-containing protein At4g21190 isoform X2 [Beta vulgaris subsp. vulgaris]|uniref:pentatricopeptide repeat-containing protein At4g21190 isoform X2 n=1 Tax=Beta vulgaris subsp. vulgaris TaxID=3555 RepID=UPI00203740DC|nr:pentatricopeptide repeat-containing protein At4g21190 isoform X2 [Beta vulgaris subsp. vulgaris]
MLRSAARYVLRHSSQLGMARRQTPKLCFSTIPQAEGRSQVTCIDAGKDNGNEHNFLVGQKITRKEKINLLITAVIKWMLSKGQGNTLGSYQQLIRALDMDHRAEEAHRIWMKKIGNNLHSVPWQACHLMISVYHRNNMLDRLVKLFKSLEAFDRKPPEKSIVQKVADAYELLGLVDDKERILEKYAALLSKTDEESKKKSNRVKSRKKETSGTRSNLAKSLKA